MPEIFIVHKDGRLRVERTGRTKHFQRKPLCFPPVPGQLFTGRLFLKKSVILMKIILPIWRISMWGTVRRSMATGTITHRLPLFFMQVAALPVQDIINSR